MLAFYSEVSPTTASLSFDTLRPLLVSLSVLLVISIPIHSHVIGQVVGDEQFIRVSHVTLFLGGEHSLH